MREANGYTICGTLLGFRLICLEHDADWDYSLPDSLSGSETDIVHRAPMTVARRNEGAC